MFTLIGSRPVMSHLSLGIPHLPGHGFKPKCLTEDFQSPADTCVWQPKWDSEAIPSLKLTVRPLLFPALLSQ